MTKLWHWFRALAQDSRRCMKHFAISAVVFFTAYGMIYWANDAMPPSLQQELYTAAAIAVMAAAFIWAIAMQICQIVMRIRS